MPRGIAGSPVAVLTAPIDADDTYIPFNTAILADGNVGICTISTSPTVFESVWYTSKDSGGVYTTDGGQRGFDGTTARSWSAGAEVARYVSAYDLDAYADNIEDHEDRIATLESTPATHTLNDLTDVVITGTPADKEVVRYDTSTSKFVNEAIVPADIGAAAATHKTNHATGGSDVLTAADIGAATTTHTHGTWTAVTPFTRVSDSSFTVTDNAANQEIFKIGRPIRYADSTGWYYYGVVKNYVTGTVTLAGLPMTSSFTSALEYADMTCYVKVRFFIPGSYETENRLRLLQWLYDANYEFEWDQGEAYIVHIRAKTEIADSGSDGYVQIYINSPTTGANLIDNGLGNYKGFLMNDPGWKETTTNFYHPEWYRNRILKPYDAIDIASWKGTNGDAQDLHVELGIVLV